MEIVLNLKDPDGVYDSVRESVSKAVDAIPGLSDSEKDLVIEQRIEEVTNSLGKWVQFGEYVTVIIDTLAGTAKVKELK